ncbi:hypothetical protein [Paenibacillus sp. Marseille-Q4541]|uniref:hypothetical protein n=1 Tax=Paenibacillus sp. Marseille-Q4541 TaxID=2831522 RepID=UPI001BA6F106|nr:hypothetical protein [Paenibacillus sp. Marseille-Q4541]
MFKEYSFVAKAKTPLASRGLINQENEDDLLSTQWGLIDRHAQWGGYPTIVGVVSIDATKNTINIPHYKLLFPNGNVDYARVDNFNRFYDFIPNF